MNKITDFFKKLIKSVKGFENYQSLSKESLKKTIMHTFLITLITSVVIIIGLIPKLPEVINEAKQYITVENEQQLNESVIYYSAVITTCTTTIITNFIAVLADIMLLSILGYMINKIMKIQLNFQSIYKFANYAIVVPIILQCIYLIVNIITGYTIKYFQIMYMLISYIYLISALIITKLDIIKNNQEVEKIIEEQEKIEEGIDFNKEK